jgi:hypothetical protein
MIKKPPPTPAKEAGIPMINPKTKSKITSIIPMEL